jgi:hypothetical protein
MRLYKYFPSARTDVLERARIRFSPPHAFNDPFDLKPNIDLFNSPARWHEQFLQGLPKAIEEQYTQLPEQVRKAISLPLVQRYAMASSPTLSAQFFGLGQELMVRLRAMMESKFEQLVGVLSLTEAPDSLLMWAHYASSHEGFVVEFDADDAFFNRKRSDNDEFFHLRQVVYRGERPTLTFDDASFEAFLTKGIEWSYEKEWRILVPLSTADEVVDNGSAIPIHLFSFPKQVVRSVIIGARATEQTRAGIVQILNRDSDYRHVTVQRALVDKRQYRLNFVDIDG